MADHSEWIIAIEDEEDEHGTQKIIEKRPLIRCKDCMSLTSGEDPDCFVCNNPISPCYQREVSENDYCRHGKDGEQDG